MKLTSSIPSNSVKLIELFNKITSGALITGPDFNRKLVWKKQHKFSFIETILMNFPFPEIYIASDEMDIEKLQAKEVVVDGQQRLTTIVDYIKGVGDFNDQKRITPFDDLSPEEKKEFLNYSISVKDLKDIGEDNVKEVFKRINSTNYSLNSNEILNAEYGGGEFAIFSKILADKKYDPSERDTDIIIEKQIRNSITEFFEKNNIFSENDTKRMFDSNYVMLIASTLLEGKYFGRNSRINYYLEKYNLEFSNYTQILGLILRVINTIKSLNLSEGSYWFNKPNLFTLIIELSKVNESEIDINLLESNLNTLENKVDIYYSGDEDEFKMLSSDETKYFEVARQGSHELAAREHRGKVIKEIIQKSTKKEEEIIIDKKSDNFDIKPYLKSLKEEFCILIPTSTGLEKNIMDATLNVREFLEKRSVHNYSLQEFGPLHKIKKAGFFVDPELRKTNTEVSLYRSNARGDFRIWFSDLKKFANEKDELIILEKNGELLILNTTREDYSKSIDSILLD